ncbi:hypothetical protein H8R18_07130 [Nanchangia anserum]|uniref:Esterase n=1 Tax=Nanchangia anserum TaxID=2692125 RepID=A0A8I0KNI0_9ACTO|nr:alpha/beta hydrolase family protein [Nanchangia anserum]MBD3689301.1 hypothetical protein [Nanchangia anserum]QOX81517.1 hypothetical protein H8R18_07130 [Nanchangia anserum]
MTQIELSTSSQILGQWIDLTIVAPEAPKRHFGPHTPAGSVPASRALADEGAPTPALMAPPRVCYLLHGTTGNHRTWTQRMVLHGLANRHHVAFVCMSAGRSFYLNWQRQLAWTDFLTEELPLLVADHIRVDTTAGSALIAGLSAGGYGAFRAALAHPENYLAAGSFSGVLDIASEFNRPRRHELYRGAFASADVTGTDADLFALAEALVSSGRRAPRLWAACGSSDHVLEQSRTFRDWANEIGLELTYAEWEGGHEWAFWDPALRAFLDWALPVP